MADDDAILRETKRSIDKLFASVSTSADKASSELLYVGKTAKYSGDKLSFAGDSAVEFGNALIGITRSLGGAAIEAQKAGIVFAAAGTAVASSLTNLDKIKTVGEVDTKGKPHLDAKSGGGMWDKFLSTMAKIPVLGSMISGGATGAGVGMMMGPGGAAAGAALGAVGGAAYGLSEEVYGSYLDGLNAITKAGVPFGRSIEKYAQSLTATTLTQTQFNSLISRNSEALAIFGGTAQEGAERFVTVGGMLSDVGLAYRDSGRSIRMTLEQMGVSMEEAMELQGTMLQSTALAEKMRNTSALEQTYMTADYIQTLSELEVLTGKSKQRLADEQKQLAADAQFRAATMDMGPKQVAAMEAAMNNLKQFGGAPAVEAFKARIAGVVPSGTEARQLLATPMGDAINTIAAEMAAAGENVEGVFERNLGKLEDGAEQTRQMFRTLAAAGNPVGVAMFKTSDVITVQFNAIQEAYAKHTGVIDAETVNFQNAMEAFYDKALGIDPEKGTIGSEATRLATDLRVTFSEANVAGREILLNSIFAADGPIIRTLQKGLDKAQEMTGFSNEVSEELKVAQAKGQASFRAMTRSAESLSSSVVGAVNTSIDYINSIHQQLTKTEEKLIGNIKEFDNLFKIDRLTDFTMANRESISMAGIDNGNAQKLVNNAESSLTESQKQTKLLEDIKLNTNKTNNVPTVVVAPTEKPAPYGNAYYDEAMSP
jgi:hypothetical protein